MKFQIGDIVKSTYTGSCFLVLDKSFYNNKHLCYELLMLNTGEYMQKNADLVDTLSIKVA
jgi:hypothetical protein